MAWIERSQAGNRQGELVDVATMKLLDDFRWMVQAEAKRRHFFTAQQRALVADGSQGNWSLWERHFADFIPILDFMHAAEYLHAAVKALESSTLGGSWVEALWQGRSGLVIAALQATLDPVRLLHQLTLSLDKATRLLDQLPTKNPGFRNEAVFVSSAQPLDTTDILG